MIAIWRCVKLFSEAKCGVMRLLLQIATATCIEPGFSGVVTLELSNVGNMPLELVPGMRIGQLILRETVSRLPNAYGTYRKYKCPIGPQFSRLHSDADAKVFRR
jgi:dCTP deaminase